MATPKRNTSGYNGHKNWNHWNVSLWLFNTESRYRLVEQSLKYEKNKDDAARRILRYVGEETTPDGAPYSFSSVRAALVGI